MASPDTAESADAAALESAFTPAPDDGGIETDGEEKFRGRFWGWGSRNTMSWLPGQGRSCDEPNKRPASTVASPETVVEAAALETAYVPAPDDRGVETTDGEVKFRVGSLFWGWVPSRNRNTMSRLPDQGQSCDKPTGLASLDEDLFHNFTADLQATANYQWGDIWACVLVFYWNVFIAPTLCWESALLEIGIIPVVVWYLRYDRLGLGDEINVKLEEWRPLFDEQGYTVEYVEDKPHWWTATETYVHIRKRIGQPQQQIVIPQTEEAKYLILFPDEIRRRNKSFRVLEASCAICVKPPALHELDDSGFVEFLGYLEAAATKSKYWKRISVCILVGAFVYGFVSYFFRYERKGFILIGLFYLIYRSCILYTDMLSRAWGVQAVIEELQPRLAEHGFTVSYHVDQPSWWLWREHYVHIQRQN
jgi:hypothetical protein